MFSLEAGREYSLRELHILLGLPEDATGGSWFNGFQRHGGVFCVFASVRAGRRQPERRDHWEGSVLFWSAKGDARLADEAIRDLVSGRWPVHIFWRRWSRGHEGGFTYAGLGVVHEARDTTPATILWTGITPPAG
jgi:hypothetical protein